MNEPKVHPLVIPGTEKRCYFIPRRELPLLRRHGFYTDTPLGLGTSLFPSPPGLSFLICTMKGLEENDVRSFLAQRFW